MCTDPVKENTGSSIDRRGKMKYDSRENYICMSYIKSMEVLMSVRRIYVEKKKPYAVQAKELREELLSYLGISTVTGVRVLIRYDIENLSD